jgi:uncharacterized protein YraI
LPFIARVVAPLCLLILPSSVLAETFVLTGSVNLRTGPGVSYARMTSLPQGSLVHVHACTPSFSWCHVSHGHLSGWASARYMAATVPNVAQFSAYGASAPVIVAGYSQGAFATTGSVPVVHGPVYQPSVIVQSHTARYPGRVVRYVEVVTNQPVVSYSWSHPYVVGHVGSVPISFPPY